MTDEKNYDDYTPEEQEMIKEIVIARIKLMRDNLQLVVG
jgi:hypothetical protein